MTSPASPEVTPERSEQQRLRLFLYLVPVVGFFPALLSLYRQTRDRPPGDRQTKDRREQSVSRLAVTLSLAWVIGLSLLGVGGQVTETPALVAMILSSMLTSGYFLVNFWLMVQLWRRKRLWLPGLSNLGKRLP
ncbi:MAG: hypothetical protein HC771_08290 [Synechococcales cyanobacterium CRU_2_2]|nr:hypothetical protein [Synechococcales cyanobacterium CRU_2_2]